VQAVESVRNAEDGRWRVWVTRVLVRSVRRAIRKGRSRATSEPVRRKVHSYRTRGPSCAVGGRSPGGRSPARLLVAAATRRRTTQRRHRSSGRALKGRARLREAWSRATVRGPRCGGEYRVAAETAHRERLTNTGATLRTRSSASPRNPMRARPAAVRPTRSRERTRTPGGLGSTPWRALVQPAQT
jgi:hypothetical protein